MNELDDMPPAQLVKIIEFQSAQQRKYRKLFINGSTPATAEVFDSAPELAMMDLGDMDAVKLLDSYREFESKFDTAPFDSDGRMFRLYPGGVTIWSGFPGAGKTTLLRQIICQLLHKGRGVFVASLEEKPDHMLARLMMTAAGTANPSKHQAQWFVDAHGERLRMWAMVGLASFKAVISAARYAIKHESCQHVFIDSLTCLDVGGTDWEGQRGVANKLCELAHSTGAHIHLVAHPRKPSKGENGTDISDIAGSSDLGRLADNVLFVKRHLDAEPRTMDQPTEMRVLIRKQRHGTGACGQIDGWFHRQYRQYASSQFLEGPIRYLPDDAYESPQPRGEF